MRCEWRCHVWSRRLAHYVVKQQHSMHMKAHLQDRKTLKATTWARRFVMQIQRVATQLLLRFGVRCCTAAKAGDVVGQRRRSSVQRRCQRIEHCEVTSAIKMSCERRDPLPNAPYGCSICNFAIVRDSRRVSDAMRCTAAQIAGGSCQKPLPYPVRSSFRPQKLPLSCADPRCQKYCRRHSPARLQSRQPSSRPPAQ